MLDQRKTLSHSDEIADRAVYWTDLIGYRSYTRGIKSPRRSSAIASRATIPRIS